MNHHKLLTLIQSCQAISTFLVNRGLLAARRRCSCGNQMVLRDDKSDDGYHWECPVNKCRKRRSIRAGSFFEDSKIPLSHWLYIIFLWSIDESNKKVSLLTGLSLRTVIMALQRLQDICSLSPCLATNASTIAGGSVKARGFSVWSREVLDKLWHSVYRTGQEKPW